MDRNAYEVGVRVKFTAEDHHQMVGDIYFVREEDGKVTYDILGEDYMVHRRIDPSNIIPNNVHDAQYTLF